MRLDRTVLITGGASGIGLATAKLFASNSYKVIIADLNPETEKIAQSLADTASATVIGRVVNVEIEDDLLSLVSWMRHTVDDCDILVNCAGVSPKGDGGPIPLENLRTEDWERVHRINLTAPFILCRELLPRMKQRGFGRVINVASRAARMHVPPAGIDYHASKTALLGLTRSLAGIYAPFGITVNSVAPGRIATPLSNTTRSDLLDQAKSLIPAGRFGEPEEIASAILFLASNASSYINGACIDVNGGVFMT